MTFQGQKIVWKYEQNFGKANKEIPKADWKVRAIKVLRQPMEPRDQPANTQMSKVERTHYSTGDRYLSKDLKNKFQ